MISLKIMTPDQGVCYNHDVLYVDIKTTQGHIGLQEHITAMIATIENGHCKIKLDNNPNNDIEVLLGSGTLYVDKTGIKVFSSAFCLLKDFKEEKINQDIKNLKDKLNKLEQTHKDFLDYQNELLRLETILDAYKK